MNGMRAVFQNRAAPLYKNFFRKTFLRYVTVWLVRIWTYKNADEKEYCFSWRRKNVQKRTKNRYRVIPPLGHNHAADARWRLSIGTHIIRIHFTATIESWFYEQRAAFHTRPYF